MGSKDGKEAEEPEEDTMEKEEETSRCQFPLRAKLSKPLGPYTGSTKLQKATAKKLSQIIDIEEDLENQY
jgi:hypothetical protein